MAFNPIPAGGGGSYDAWCASCRRPILDGERRVRVRFNHDPHGFRGLTGLYHERCAGPFKSMARVVNLNWWGKF